MQRAKPFARVLAFISALREATSLNAVQALGEYQSRGKGLGKHSGKKWGSGPSYRCDMVRHANGLWYQKENGDREVARRQRQITRGILQVS